LSDLYSTIAQLNVMFQALTLSMLGLDNRSVWASYQASLTAIKTITIANGGLNYQAGNILTITGGNGAGRFTVVTVDGSGTILTGTISAAGTGYVLVSGIAVTGGSSGTGATLNITVLGTWTTTVPVNPFSLVRISWLREGAPAWKVDEDVCFIRVAEVDDQYNKQHDVSYDGANVRQTTSYTKVLRVAWVFYGPNSYDRASTMKDQIFLQEGHDALSRNGIYLIPDIKAPQRLPEAFEGHWWERTDLNIEFNELVRRETTRQNLETSEIRITRNGTNYDQIDLQED
jgi:hypothetical protein